MTVQTVPAVGPSYGASPPAGPIDGQHWILPADATNGVMWTFRYNAASGSGQKWEFIGGSPLLVEVQTDEAIASPQTTYQPGTTLVQVTIPRTGSYQVSHGATMYAATAGSILYFTVGTSGAGWLDSECVQVTMDSALAAIAGARTMIRSYTAADVVQQRYKNSGTNATDALRRWLSVLPVRVA